MGGEHNSSRVAFPASPNAVSGFSRTPAVEVLLRAEGDRLDPRESIVVPAPSRRACAAIAMTAANIKKVTGSVAGVSNSSACIVLVSANAAINPMTTPTAVSAAPSRRIIQRTSLGLAPSARRMPISRARPATMKAMTP